MVLSLSFVWANHTVGQIMLVWPTGDEFFKVFPVNQMTILILIIVCLSKSLFLANASSLSITFAKTKMTGEPSDYGYDFFLEEHMRLLFISN